MVTEDDMEFTVAPGAWSPAIAVTDDDAASIKVRENSLRRLAERRGYRLVKSRSRDPRATDFGRYKIVETATGAVVAGDDGRGGCAYSFGEAEEYLAAARPPAVAFAVRDDGDAETWNEEKVGRWLPRDPSQILADNWTVGWMREIQSGSGSPLAGHKVVFAYEDQASGRLPDDNPRSAEFRLYGKPVRFTESLRRIVWPAGRP
jgi:hypothetical protein